MPFHSLAMMYTNGIGKRQRHWTPAFAGVTLFEVIALELFGVITLLIDPMAFLFGLMAFLFGLMAFLFGLMAFLCELMALLIDLIAFLFGLMALPTDLMALKLSSRRRPGSSVVRTSAINA